MERERTPARRQRLTSFAAIAVLAGSAAVAFGRIFEHGTVWRILAAALASAGVACALERKSLWVATLVSGASMVLTLGVLVFPHATWHGLPTAETLTAMRTAAAHIGQEARVQVAPSPAVAPLLLAAVAAIWAAVFSAHALAVRAGSPLLGLVPPVALVAFADTVLDSSIRPQFGLFFLIGALTVIFVDGTKRVQRWGPTWAWPGAQGRRVATASRGARRVASVSIASAVVFAIVMPGWGADAVVDLGGSTGGDGVGRVDPLVSIRASLTRGQPQALFEVATNKASYYRFVALDSFDGTTWRPRLAPQDAEVDPAVPLVATAGAATFQQRFHLLTDLQLVGLPAAYPPVQVAVDAPVHYDPATGTLVLNGTLASGSDYTVSSELVQPTPEQLAAVIFPAPSADARYTALPVDPTTDQIRTIAERWTQGQTSDYERILAIQDRLRQPPFSYNINVPARDDSYDLVTFLTKSQEGFCQQFASAMAVMLRSIGIPARVAVGFTNGTFDPLSQTWRVSTDDAHAWVDVPFPGYGWLSFEPTPGRTNPIANSIDNPTTACAPGSGQPCQPAGRGTNVPGQGQAGNAPIGNFPREGVIPSRGRSAATGGGGIVAPAASRPISARMVLLLAIMLGLVALLFVPPVRAVRRRIRLRRAAHEPRRLILATYEVFTAQAADLGLARGPGETPQEYRTRLRSSDLLSSQELDRLTALASRAAYAPGAPGADDAAQAGRAARDTIRDLRRHTSRGRRIAGSFRRGP